LKVNNVFIQVSSDNPEQLRAFYADVIGLPPAPMGFGALDAGGPTIGFDEHSEISGKTREPARVLINLAVDDVAAEEARLTASGVVFIRRQGREPWGGIISTFVDPDGNYAQLIGREDV
jgi:predicted enzyme related to lactoylglutathione lyase